MSRIESVEFHVGNTLTTSKFFSNIGFEITSRESNTVRMKNGQVHFSFTSGQSDSFWKLYQKHGDLSIYSVTFGCRDVKLEYENALKGGAISIESPTLKNGVESASFLHPHLTFIHNVTNKMHMSKEGEE